LLDLLVEGGSTMAIRMMDDTMTLEIDNCFVATAQFSELAAGDGNGARIVSTHLPGCAPATRKITALIVIELGERAATPAAIPLVAAPRVELQ
jgi:hypothetical protein